MYSPESSAVWGRSPDLRGGLQTASVGSDRNLRFGCTAADGLGEAMLDLEICPTTKGTGLPAYLMVTLARPAFPAAS